MATTPNPFPPGSRVDHESGITGIVLHTDSDGIAEVGVLHEGGYFAFHAHHNTLRAAAPLAPEPAGAAEDGIEAPALEAA